MLFFLRFFFITLMFVCLQKILNFHTRQIHRFHRVHEICDQSDLAILRILISLLISNLFISPSPLHVSILPQTLQDNNSEKMKTVFGNSSMCLQMSVFILFIRG